MLMIMVLSVICGLVVSLLNIVPPDAAKLMTQMSMFFLCLMLVVIGYGIGKNRLAFKNFAFKDPVIILLPVCTVTGTLLGGVAASFFIKETLLESTAISAGLGWYSYAAVYLTETMNADVGAVAFLTSIIRELLTVLCAPLIIRFFSVYSAISSGGATSMDVSLPVIVKYGGSEHTVISFWHGTVLSLIIPFLLPLIASLG